MQKPKGTILILPFVTITAAGIVGKVGEPVGMVYIKVW